MFRRTLVDTLIFGMAYLVVLTGCSLVAGLALGILMRPVPASPALTPAIQVSPTSPSSARPTAAFSRPTRPPTAAPPTLTATARPPTALPTRLPTALPTMAGAPEGTCFVVYTVEAGDTVTGLARRFGVAVEDIVRNNNLPTTASLKIGQQLIIPACDTSPP